VREILDDLEIQSIQLLTNNPRKISCLEELGVQIEQRIACESPKERLTKYSRTYINAKVARMGHLIEPTENQTCLEEFVLGEPKLQEEAITFTPIQDALKIIAEGGMAVVMDDESRENEGDIIMAASKCTAAQVAFTVRHTTGILCAPMTRARAQELELPPMVTNNKDPKETAFTVSCDAVDTTTGVSARDRMVTFHTLAAKHTTALDITRPGHIFPLVAKDGGVLERDGHTEAGVDLCRLALPDEEPVALISELTNDDGTMKRLPECAAFAKEHQLPLITIEALQKYRLAHPHQGTTSKS